MAAVATLLSIVMFSPTPTDAAAFFFEGFPECSETACTKWLGQYSIFGDPILPPIVDDDLETSVVGPPPVVGVASNYQFYDLGIADLLDSIDPTFDDTIYEIGQQVTIETMYDSSSCAITIGGEACNSCTPCASPETGMSADCSNILGGKVTDVCESDPEDFYDPYSLILSQPPLVLPTITILPTISSHQIPGEEQVTIVDYHNSTCEITIGDDTCDYCMSFGDAMEVYCGNIPGGIYSYYAMGPEDFYEPYFVATLSPSPSGPPVFVFDDDYDGSDDDYLAFDRDGRPLGLFEMLGMLFAGGIQGLLDLFAALGRFFDSLRG